MVVVDRSVLCVVGNIPGAFRVADLRCYFSDFTEEERFACFHFRRRPEVVATPGEDVDALRRETSCCLVAMRSLEDVDEVQRRFHRRQWFDKEGHYLDTACHVRRLKALGGDPGDDPPKFKTRAEKRTDPFADHVNVEDLPELHPPVGLPNGNVGTPLRVIHELISCCALPARVVKQLGIRYEKRAKGRFGRVPYDYGTRTMDSEGEEGEEEGEGEGEEEEEEEKEGSIALKHDETCDSEVDAPEEWDRHVSNRGGELSWVEQTARPGEVRPGKEQVYEEEVDLQWEKGGPGLVFYTDEVYWRMQEGDQDEQQADDWDVEVIEDHVSEQLPWRRKRGRIDNDPSRQLRDTGSFERYTLKGLAGQLIRRMGWTPGTGLGRGGKGIVRPLAPFGQWGTRGVGYGEDTGSLRRQRSTEEDRHIIGTVFDRTPSTEHEGSLRSRSGLRSLITFVPASSVS